MAAGTATIAQNPPAAGAADPSMEDILASIRRILSEDEAAPAPPEVELPPRGAPMPNLRGAAAEDPGDGVLELDASMIVPPERAVTAPEPALPLRPSPQPVAGAAPAPVSAGLLDGESEAAAAASVSQLVRSLNVERHTAVYRGGPTLEDMVLDTLRPLLKSWLDQNLPPMVERLVQTEIERVTARAIGL